MQISVDRRRHERFSLSPMHTAIAVRTPGEKLFTLFGHAMDISEGGIRFELDRAIPPGSKVEVQIDLPRPVLGLADRWSPVSIRAVLTIVWCEQQESGAARVAGAISSFASEDDRRALLEQLGSGRYLRAA